VTPDLDQTLSLKAQLKDSVSPQLRKIQELARSTRAKFEEAVQAFSSGGEQMGSSTQKAADQVEQSSAKIKQGLTEVAQTFESTGEAAKTNSSKIGKAVEDALYTKGASSRIDELEKDLGVLNKTFQSMAASQKTVSGKARTMQAVAHDSLHKKVIPAFQELNATLNDYPETLEEINKLEQDRLKYLEKGEGLLSKVKDRVKGVESAVNTIQLGVQDAVAAGTTGVVGSVGMEVQEQQRGAARIAGADYFKTLPQTLAEVSREAETTIDNVQPITEAIMELRSAPRETLGPLVKEIYNIEKASGLAGAEVAQLYDHMARLGGIKGEDMTVLMDQVKYFAEESVASTDEMFQTLQRAGDQISLFSGEARQAFAQASLAAAASSANMGLGVSGAADLQDRLINDPTAMARAQGFLNAAGIDKDLQGLYSAGKQDEAFEAMAQAMRQQFQGVDFANAVQRQAVSAQAGPLFDVDTIAKIVQNATLTGEKTGGTAPELAAQAKEKARGKMAETAEVTRATFVEELEKAGGATQQGLLESGRKTVEAFSTATDKATEAISKFTDTFNMLDEKLGGKLSTGVAAGTTVMAARTGMRALGAGVQQTGLPGADALGGIVGGQGALGTIAHVAGGAYIAKELFSDQEDKTSEVSSIIQGDKARRTLEVAHQQAVKAATESTNPVERDAARHMTGGIGLMDAPPKKSFGLMDTPPAPPSDKSFRLMDTPPAPSSDKSFRLMDTPPSKSLSLMEYTQQTAARSMGPEPVALSDQLRQAIAQGKEQGGPVGSDTVQNVMKAVIAAVEVGETVEKIVGKLTSIEGFEEVTKPPVSVSSTLGAASLTEEEKAFRQEIRKEIENYSRARAEQGKGLEKPDPNLEKQTQLQTEMTTHLKVIADGFKASRGKEATPQRPGYTPALEQRDYFMDLDEGRR
jgi:chaperonin cofactor prefoldin